LKNKINGTRMGIITMIFVSMAVVFSLGVSTVSADQSHIYVSNTGNDLWDGQNATWNGGTSGPKATIINATSVVAENGTVYIANGTYNEHNISINTNMNIIGESQQNTIINGTGSGPIFYVAPLINASIFNLTLVNGNNTGLFGGATHDSTGGAIYNDGNLNVTNCTFNNNTALYSGGAIYSDGTLTVTNSAFNGNTVTSSVYWGDNYHRGMGGAIFNEGPMTITNCTFSSDTALFDGGAIYNNYYVTVIVTNSTFNNNTVKMDVGGAIHNAGVLELINSLFSGNSAVYGGAVYSNADLTVTNCTFTSNTAQYYGGAMITAGTLNMTNSSFNNNTAVYNGGAVFNNGGLFNITSSIFNGNTVGDTGGAIYDEYGDPTDSISFSQIINNGLNQIYEIGSSMIATLNW